MHMHCSAKCQDECIKRSYSDRAGDMSKYSIKCNKNECVCTALPNTMVCVSRGFTLTEQGTWLHKDNEVKETKSGHMKHKDTIV